MKFLLVLIGVLAICSAFPVNCEIVEETANENKNNENNEKCTGFCSKIFAPVCAADDHGNYKYFHNHCMMNNASCQNGIAWRLTKMLNCLENVESYMKKECLRPCPFIYEPICATNGIVHEIFSNNCIFQIENCLVNKKWSIVDISACGNI